MSTIKVYVNDINSGKRKIVEVEVVKENPASFVVRLPDGKVIKRKKKRDVVMEEGKDAKEIG